MSTIFVAPTAPTSKTLTRAQAIKRLLREEGGGEYGTTTAAGSTTTLVDANLIGLPSEMFALSWVRFVTGTLAGNKYVLTRDGFNNTNGTLIFTPTAGSAPGSAADYEIHRWIRPQLLLDAFDDWLIHECYAPAYEVLSELADHDMEQNNTTDWATTSNATPTKVSDVGMRGNRSLQVANSGANGYVQAGASGTTIRVVPGRHYHLSADVRATVGTAQLIAYDLSNGAAIRTLTSTQQACVRLWMEFAAPEGCYQLGIRLGGVGATAVSIWDSVAFYDIHSGSIALPWWVENEDQVKAIYQLRPNQAVNQANTYEAALVGPEDERHMIQRDEFGRGQLRAVLRSGGGQPWPLWIAATRPETAWASDTEVKHLDGSFVHAGMRLEYLKLLRNRAPESVRPEFEKRFRMAEEDWNRAKRQQSLVMERVDPSPPQWVGIV